MLIKTLRNILIFLCVLVATIAPTSGDTIAPTIEITDDKPQVPLEYNQPEFLKVYTIEDKCSCVKFARKFSGVPVYGKAWEIVPNTHIPIVGSVVLTREGPFNGHAAVVLAVENNQIVLGESNYVDCEITYGRKLDISSQTIRGYSQK